MGRGVSGQAVHGLNGDGLEADRGGAARDKWRSGTVLDKQQDGMIGHAPGTGQQGGTKQRAEIGGVGQARRGRKR